MADAMDVADDAGEFVGDDAQNDAELTEQPVVETTRSKRRVRPPQTLVESIAATKPRRKRKATPKVAGMRGGGKSEGSSGRSRISSSRDVTSYVSALDATGDGSGVKALGAKHRAVKRKFNALVFESNEIMDCLERHARNNVRLLEQRNYLLDRVAAMEEYIEQNDLPPFDYKSFISEQASKRRKIATARKPKSAKKKDKAPEKRIARTTCGASPNGKKCTGRCLPNLMYCLLEICSPATQLHAPLDPSSGYIFCTFSKADGWQCAVPVSTSLGSTLCTFHRKEIAVAEPIVPPPAPRRSKTKSKRAKREKKEKKDKAKEKEKDEEKEKEEKERQEAEQEKDSTVEQDAMDGVEEEAEGSPEGDRSEQTGDGIE